MRTLVENCFALTIKLIKKDLRRVREQKIALIDGYINISFGNVKRVADYSIEIGSEYDYLIVRYNLEEQRIKLVQSELHFGPRDFFVCNCEKRVAKLYLPPNATLFKCRACHKLRYQTINRNSKHGEVIYQLSQRVKIMDTREKMARIFYKSKHTKRYERWLRNCGKVGLIDEIINALKLVELIKGAKSVD